MTQNSRHMSFCGRQVRHILLALSVLFAAHCLLPAAARADCTSPAGVAGTVVYNNDHSMLQYCNGSDQWIKMGPQTYVPNAVSFAGSDWLSRGGDLTGIADTKQATGAGWFRRTSSGAAQTIYTSTASRLKFRFNSSDYFNISATNAALTEILNIRSQNAITDTNWHHFMFSFDLADTNKRHLYIDGVSSISALVYTNDIIDATTTNHAIGSDTGGSANHWQGDLADIWFDIGTYIDLSSAVNRRKFLLDSGLPVYLGADGSLPTGSAPDIYLSGDTANWHVNTGTGGGFTENGTLTDAATGPTDPPTLGSGAWTQVGNSFSLVHDDGALTVLSPNTIAHISESGDQLRTYRWDGTNWAQVGNSLAIPSTDPVLATLNSRTVAYLDEVNNQLRTYEWNGASWSLVGSGLTIAGGVVGNPAIEGIDENTIAFVDDTFDQLRTYTWDGSTWFQTGNALGLTTVNGSFIAKLSENTIALVNASGDTIKTYIWDGTDWSVVGNPANLVSIADPTLTALDDNTVIFLDETIKQLRTYAWDGTNWLQKGGFISFSSASSPELVTLDSRTIAYLDSFYDTLRTYQNAVGCKNPNGLAGMTVYNRNVNTMQFCNGSVWLDMNPIAEPVDGLVGHWKLEEITFTSARDSVNGNNGTLNNGLNPVNNSVLGVQGRAFDFDGVDDRIEATNDNILDIIGDLTVSVWAFRDTSTTDDTFIDHGDGGELQADNHLYEFLVTDTNYLRLEWEYGAGTNVVVTSSVPVSNPAGRWVNYSFTRDVAANQVRFYENGVQLGATQSYATDPDGGGTGEMTIGGNVSSTDFFDGKLDEIRIYNRVMSADEIADLYHKSGGNPVGDPMSGLVGYWPMDDGAGASAAADMAGRADASDTGGVVFGSTGKIGSAASFDGADDILKPDFNSALDNIAKLTFTAWIYPTDWGGGTFGRVASKETAASDGGVEIYVGSDTAQRLQVRSNRPTTDGLWVSPNSSIVLNTWQHLAVVYDNSSTANDPTIYINGVPVTATETSTPSGSPASDASLRWRIGNSNIQTRGFEGRIDDVRIYNRLLTAAEIDAIYDAGAAGKAAIDCTGPDGIEGEMLYNIAHNVMQFCNGRSWIAITGHGNVLGSGQ